VNLEELFVIDRMKLKIQEVGGDGKKPGGPDEVTRKTFELINDRSVDDISLEFFYQPHTITLLLACISGLVYIAFTRSNNDPVRTKVKGHFLTDEQIFISSGFLFQSSNIFTGICGVFVFFMIVSVLAFPNGPFTR
jgi:phosphatidylserine synthase 1